MTAIGTIVKGTLDYSTAKAGIDLDLTPLDNSWTSVKQVIGSNYDDTIMGNMAGYRTTLSGGLGNDTLASQGFTTIFNGGAGSDTVSYAWGYEGAYVDLSLGVSMSGEQFIGIENVTGGLGNNTLIGDANVNRLTGNLMGDWLDGGEGADILIGSGGSDIYIVDNIGDKVVEDFNDGLNDRVIASISYALSDNVEHLTLEGDKSLNGTGNDLNNSLLGNGGANILSGLDGNDKIRGNAGNDTLLGGDGIDVLTGGKGADRLVGGDGRDVFDYELVSDSTLGASDHIADFVRGTDRIDLHDIDARVSASGNNAFSWIGVDDFSGAEGELRYEAIKGDTLVTGDTNGDGIADFAITLDDFAGALRAGDFVL